MDMAYSFSISQAVEIYFSFLFVERGICARRFVVLSQLLNSNFKFYNPCILSSKEKQIKEIQLHFRGDYNFFRKSYIYE